jgi:hypothetical protein
MMDDRLRTTAVTQAEPLSGTICEDLSAEDRVRLQEAARALLNARGLVLRFSDFLGGRLEQLAGGTARRMLAGAEARMRGPIERALWHAYRVATFGLDRGGATPWSRTRRMAASASGMVSGLFGMPGLALDLPFTTATMLRAIAEIARAAGEDIRDPDTRRACIEVFTLGSVPGENSDIELSYWTTRATLNHATVGMTIQQSARLLTVPLSQKLLAQSVPIAGALAGGTLNYVFMDYYQQIARVHFAVRALERRTGNSEAVRACLHAAVEALRAQRE